MIEIKMPARNKVVHLDIDTLVGADLTGRDLHRAVLSGENLQGIQIRNCDARNIELRGSDLRDANLSNSALMNTSMEGANLQGAKGYNTHFGGYLTGANLSKGIFAGARFSLHIDEVNFAESDLMAVTFNHCFLRDTDFTGARLGATVFLDCADLHKAKGLDAIQHLSPSTLDPVTLRANVPYLPDAFLLGIGYTGEELVGLRQIYPTPTEA
jgi:uncharacterized protein YjbI with pentapeptide repeats